MINKESKSYLQQQAADNILIIIYFFLGTPYQGLLNLESCEHTILCDVY